MKEKKIITAVLLAAGFAGIPLLQGAVPQDGNVRTIPARPGVRFFPCQFCLHRQIACRRSSPDGDLLIALEHGAIAEQWIQFHIANSCLLKTVSNL